MKTSAQREKHFREDLEILLNRHGARLNVTDDGKPYGMHSPILMVEMDAIYDDSGDGDLLADFAEFEL